MKKLYPLLSAAVAAILLASCGGKSGANATYIKDAKELQTALINAKDGDTVFVDEGTIEFTASLSMDRKKNVTIKGKGMGKTILSFKGMKAGTGGEGLKVSNSENILVSDMTLRDMKGDGFKASECFGITMRKLQVVWSNPNDSTNGAYGLYPVTSTNVVVEDCEVANASDAGIYIGQSYYGVIRRNNVHDNVAGIEVENCQNIDVYENDCYNNTGGLLAFNLPDLAEKNGHSVRIFKNKIHDNNLANFAPKGNTVAIVPAGTGFFVMATPDVEVFNNEFSNNKTAQCGIISYITSGKEIKDAAYNPFLHTIHIHDNTFNTVPAMPDTTRPMGKVLAALFKGKTPEIIFDGLLNPKDLVNGKLPEEKRICVRNNKNATFVNLDMANNMKGLSTDATLVDCSLPAIPEYKAADKKVPSPVLQVQK